MMEKCKICNGLKHEGECVQAWKDNAKTKIGQYLPGDVVTVKIHNDMRHLQILQKFADVVITKDVDRNVGVACDVNVRVREVWQIAH